MVKGDTGDKGAKFLRNGVGGLALNCSVEYSMLKGSAGRVGYGVTANIAASHVTLVRGSSGFDSPYPSFFCLIVYSLPTPPR